LHHKLVVLEQYFFGDIRVVLVAGVRRAIAVVISVCGDAEEGEQD
jgi:hypothetical protein